MAQRETPHQFCERVDGEIAKLAELKEEIEQTVDKLVELHSKVKRANERLRYWELRCEHVIKALEQNHYIDRQFFRAKKLSDL